MRATHIREGNTLLYFENAFSPASKVVYSEGAGKQFVLTGKGFGYKPDFSAPGIRWEQ